MVKIDILSTQNTRLPSACQLPLLLLGPEGRADETVVAPKPAMKLAVLAMALVWPSPSRVESFSAGQSAPATRDARGVPRVTAEELSKRRAQKQVLVVDVRDAVAFTSGHIAGAVHAPAKDIAGHAAELKRLAGTRTVVTYCSCAAEQSAAEAGLVLLQHGIDHVSALIGGYPGWVHAGGASESGQGSR
jgi:rhodanese-related sulfurtransferase